MEIVLIIGKILFGGIFTLFGVNHFMKLQNMAGYAASKGIPSPKLATILTGLMLVLAGLGILFGYEIVIALWLLVIFLVPTSIVMHPFWKETNPQTKMMEMTNFLKNMALAGAALMMIALI